MKKLNTEKFWRVILLIMLIGCILPLLWLARYNHSSADDYSFGCLAHLAWVDTHNFLQVLCAVGEKIKNTYLTWQGSYSAVALFALVPSIWGEQYYVLTTFVVLGFFLFGNFLFWRKLVTIMGGNRSIGDIVASICLLLSIELLPSPVEGLFWWNGAVYYVVFYTCFLIYTVLLIESVWNDRCSAGKMTGLCVFGVFIAGGNYITALLMMETGFLILLWAVVRKKKVAWKIVVVYLLLVAGFLTNCLAPGNAVRQSAFEAWSPVRAVLYSFHEAYDYMITWTQPLVLLGILFLIPFLWTLPPIFGSTLFDSTILGSKRKALWGYLTALVLQYCLFASTFTPTLYAYGEVGAGRIQNIRFFFWLLSCVVMEYMLICILRQILEEGIVAVTGEKGTESLNRMLKLLFEKYAPAFFGCILFLGAFFVGNTLLADDTEDLVSVTAVKSIVSGEAKAYDLEMKERQQAYLSDDTELQLSPLSVKPELLFWTDMTDNPDEWVNGAVARFYRKEKVYLGGEE